MDLALACAYQDSVSQNKRRSRSEGCPGIIDPRLFQRRLKVAVDGVCTLGRETLRQPVPVRDDRGLLDLQGFASGKKKQSRAECGKGFL